MWDQRYLSLASRYQTYLFWNNIPCWSNGRGVTPPLSVGFYLWRVTNQIVLWVGHKADPQSGDRMLHQSQSFRFRNSFVLLASRHENTDTTEKCWIVAPIIGPETDNRFTPNLLLCFLSRTVSSTRWFLTLSRRPCWQTRARSGWALSTRQRSLTSLLRVSCR